jgi:hypothetical protein
MELIVAASGALDQMLVAAHSHRLVAVNMSLQPGQSYGAQKEQTEMQ